MIDNQAESADSPLQAQIALTLERMIRTREIRPGQRVLEVRVAEAFQVSRSPARLALQMLDAKRLLRRDGGRGYVVAGRLGVGAGTRAELGEVLATLPKRRAAHMYEAVERELATHVLFRSVRIVEERLAEHFGVSRTIARDVLTRLAGTGLLGKDSAGRWKAARVTAARVRDLYQLRWALEPEALVSAGPLVDGSLVLAMQASLRSAIADLPRVSSRAVNQLEADLHVRLLSCCPNPELLRALRTTQLLLISNHAMLDNHLSIDPGTAGQAMREHLQVMNEIRGNNFAGAADALGQHLRNSLEPWLVRFHAMQFRAEPSRPAYLIASH